MLIATMDSFDLGCVDGAEDAVVLLILFGDSEEGDRADDVQVEVTNKAKIKFIRRLLDRETAILLFNKILIL